MKTAITTVLSALMLASIISIGYWAAFDVGWWKPYSGDADMGRAMTLIMLHVMALLGLPLYKA